METNLKETLENCRKFNFNEEITREVLWNTAYDLGRSRWHWGPRWWVSFIGWVNTQRGKLKNFLWSQSKLK